MAAARTEFRVTGTITLSSTLPEVADSQLMINGPAAPAITIDGGSNPHLDLCFRPKGRLDNLIASGIVNEETEH